MWLAIHHGAITLAVLLHKKIKAVLRMLGGG